MLLTQDFRRPCLLAGVCPLPRVDQELVGSQQVLKIYPLPHSHCPAFPGRTTKMARGSPAGCPPSRAALASLNRLVTCQCGLLLADQVLHAAGQPLQRPSLTPCLPPSAALCLLASFSSSAPLPRLPHAPPFLNRSAVRPRPALASGWASEQQLRHL